MTRFLFPRVLQISVFACALALLPSMAARAAESQAKSAPQQPVLTGQAAFTDAAHEVPRHPPPSDRGRPARPGPRAVGGQRPHPRSPSGQRLAHRPQGLQGGALRHRSRQSAPAAHRAQRRPLPGRERNRQDQGLPRRGRGRQSQAGLGLRRPACTSPSASPFIPSDPIPRWVYIGDTDGIVRFPYKNGDLKARGPQEHLADLPGGGRLRGGGHWTRDLVFSKDGTKLFASVGSHSNVDDSDTHPEEFHRADVLEFTPEGKFVKVYASGIRNCVGEAINPITGELWCSTNERDALGNNLVPDYVTHVQEDGFYGWPWFYMGGPNGGIQDPRHPGKHPELQSKVITPDILVNPHFASLEMLFYEGSQFPAEYKGDGFAAEHGSWNRAQRSGYEVIRLPMKNGHATGEYEDFLTGFVNPDGTVWGRPVGVAVAKDGSLFVSDDGSRSIWHVIYTGK